MTINLTKGQKVDLTKGTGIKKIDICLGWDVQQFDGKPFDLDASAFLLSNQGKLTGDQDLVFYNNLNHPSKSVIHSGDNLTGAGEGDDEIIKVDLTKIPPNIDKIAFTVTIHEAETRRQNFGMVSNAFVRAVNADTNEEILRYDLGEDYSTQTSIVACEVYRHGGEWKFNAVGSGFVGDLGALIRKYGGSA